MWKNHFRVAIRHLKKNKVISLINVTGLTAGISCCLLILLFVAHELSYDTWNPQADRIVRPVSDINFGSNLMQMAVVGAPVGPQTAAELPEVEAFCRFRQYGSYLVRKEGENQENFREDNVLIVDSSFFRIFPLPLLEGNPVTCLTKPNTLVLSEGTAVRYFGSPQRAMGQTLVLDDQDQWQVTGVYTDIPSNTHFTADLLLSMTGNQEVAGASPLWAVSNNFHTYLLLKEGISFEDFRKKFRELSGRKIDQVSNQLLGMSLAEFEATGQHARLELQRLRDIHLHSDLDVELSANGSIQYVWLFGAIALFVLLIACINYMNLSTARSLQRAREVGIHKVLGGRRRALILQFLSESTLIALISLLVALNIVIISLPWFSELTGRAIEAPGLGSGFWMWALAGTVITGILAGSYPAFFLSKFDALPMLKGQPAGPSKKAGARSMLVVFQFVSSIALLISTLLVYHQLNYIQNKKLGFDKKQVLILNNAFALGNNVETLKQEMLNLPAVESATVSSYLPIPSARSSTTYHSSRQFTQENSVNMGEWAVDHDYLQTLGLEMAEGRFFDPDFPTDSNAIVLNQTAVKHYGFTEPIGKKVFTLQEDIQGKPAPEDFTEYTVIGVVKDFHWASLRENIGSLGLYLGRSTGLMSFRYKADQSRQVITSLETLWQRMAPGQPFSYRFLNESFAKMYQAEQRIGKIALLFTALAILISCLGLFGLASFMAEQRTKEIGIRKVLGASVISIIALLSKDFLLLVLIALLIGSPVAWYFMENWLSNFAYRVEIEWWLFAVAGGLALLIAFITIGFQSTRAALANPVKSLRNE